jgi:hypothetical protein
MNLESARVYYPQQRGPAILELTVDGEKHTYCILSVKTNLLDLGLVYFSGAESITIAKGAFQKDPPDPPADMELSDMTTDPVVVGTVRAFLQAYDEAPSGRVKPGPFPIEGWEEQIP